MSQSGYTPILIYASGTATNVPLAANMTSSASGAELALNYADGKLYYKNSSGAVTLLASATTVTNSFSAGTTGFTPNTATTGAVTLAGTLNVANGGTGQTTLATGALGYGQGTSAHASLAIGTAGQVLTVNSGATAPQWSTLSGVAVTTFSAGTTGFTPSSATAGAVTLAGTLATTNGGTGLTSFTANGVVYASSTSALTTGSALTFDGTNLGIGTSSPSATLDVVGTARILTNTGATNTGDQNAVVVGATTTGAYASSYGAGLQFQVTNSSGGYSGGRIVSRLAADNNTANLVFQARNYGFSDSMTLNASGQLMLATTTAQASFTIGTGGTTNTNAIIVGPTSGTATVGDKIVIGFQLRNDVGGGTGNQYAAAIAGIQDKASSNGGGLGFYTQASAGDGTPERGRFTSNGTFKIGVANSSVGTSNLLIVGSGNTQNAVSVINTADVATPALIISNWTGSTTSNGARLQFDNSGRGTFIIGTSSGANNFDICQTWGSPALRIDTNNIVLIGSTSAAGNLPASTLQVGSGFAGITNTGSIAPTILTSGSLEFNFDGVSGSQRRGRIYGNGDTTGGAYAGGLNFQYYAYDGSSTYQWYTGMTMSSVGTINTTSASSNAMNIAYNGSWASGNANFITMYMSNMTGGTAGLALGKASGTYNTSKIIFGYAGSGSSSNYLGLGFWDADSRFTLYPTGNASLTGTLTQNTSDDRLKTDFVVIKNALSKVRALSGFTHAWNDLAVKLNSADPTIRESGVSAQKVKEVLPEAVCIAPFDQVKGNRFASESGEDYLTVMYEKLVPLLIEAIKELDGEISILKTKQGV